VDSKGNFLYKPIGEVNTEESIREYIAENDILFSVAFGPVLVENGEARECTWYPLGEAFDLYSRAGIGMVDDCHYLYMSLNHGSQPARWTVNEFAKHFAEKPVRTAYCMDGGQTGQVVFRNTPYSYMDWGEERVVSDILYFVTAIPEDER
jgi:exopolysaccharide biosynthesis protein